MADASFAPDESAADLWTERSLFAGTMLGCVSYGIHLCIFATTFYHMLPCNRDRNSFVRPSIWSFVYVWTVFALGTFQAGGNIKFFEKMWIDDRDVPGGPAGWYANFFGDPVNTFASVAYIIAALLQDGMLLYRLLVIWNFKWLVAVIPFLALLASTALSILVVFQSSRPNAGLWTQLTVNVTVPYFSISIGLNILMTLAIAGRMLYMRRRVVAVLGKQHARMYTSVASMFIESGAVYSTLGLIFIISYARSSNVQNLVLQSLDQAVCIAPELIVLRVTLGRAWSRDTTTTLTTGDYTPSGAKRPTSISVQFAHTQRTGATGSSNTYGLFSRSGRSEKSGLTGSTKANSANGSRSLVISTTKTVETSTEDSYYSRSTIVNRSTSDVKDTESRFDIESPSELIELPVRARDKESYKDREGSDDESARAV